MAAPSPNSENTDLVSFDILVNGKAIDPTTEVISINIDKKINTVPSARIRVLDGNPSNGDFPVSDSNTFIPGNTVVIQLGYHTKNNIVFQGIITKQNIKLSQGQSSSLEIVCYDTAIRMTVGRKNATFTNVKDSDAFKLIAGNYSGMKTDIQDTQNVLPQLTQYYATDWDFICSRAKVNGQIVVPNNNKLTIQKPDIHGGSVLTLTNGKDILNMNLELDSVTQLSSVQSSSWDSHTQSVIHATSVQSISGPGNLSSKKLADVVGLHEYQLQTSAAIGNAGLQNWANAQIKESALAKITGTVSFQGTHLAEPNKVLTMDGIGDRFSGDSYISAVSHIVEAGNWTTEVELGIPIDCQNTNSTSTTEAAGLLPAIQGIHNATVQKISEDPDNQYRVQVQIPLISDTGIWARLSNFYASNRVGSFFYPEVGDEVLVGFINNDPRYPVILGSVYSDTNLRPPFEPDEQNSKKGIVTKSGLKLVFDDENKITSILTPQNNKIILSDQDKSITIADQNSNTIVMSDSGISIKSAKNIDFQADQNINIKSGTGTNISASGGDINLSGLNVKATAEMEASIKGNTTATLSGSAEVTIQGAMVMIN